MKRSNHSRRIRRKADARRWRRRLLAGFAALVGLLVLGSFVGAAADAHFYAGCKKSKCKWHVVAPHNSHLDVMAHCESRQHWHIDGAFDGGLQFSPSTWSKTGSRYAFAYQAPILEQKYRAVIWASLIGWRWRSTAGWPNCG